LNLDRHDGFSIVVFWTIYTSTDRPRVHSVRRVRDQDFFSGFPGQLRIVMLLRQDDRHPGVDFPEPQKYLEMGKGLTMECDDDSDCPTRRTAIFKYNTRSHAFSRG
jgi:hypothetical protein